MVGYELIESFARRAADSFAWEDSFIRECYLTTDECGVNASGDSTGVAMVDGPRHARIVVALPWDANNAGIEFLFRELEIASVQSIHELTFEYSFDRHSGHSVRFCRDAGGGLGTLFVAKSVLVRSLGKHYRGSKLALGYEFPTADAVLAMPVDDWWRQCGKCANVWRESPRVVYARCEDCGVLTRLVQNDGA